MKGKVGLYSVGLKTYWAQFPGLEQRLAEYNRFIEKKLNGFGQEVYNFGMVDDPDKAREAGEYFKQNDVDIVFLHLATYATSAAVVPVHQICKAPTVILNLQPGLRVNYEKTTTGEWLAHCNACVAPEISNAFHRCGISYRVISGLLGLEKTPKISVTEENTAKRPEAVRAWKEAEEWVRAAAAVRTLRYARFGFLGNTYSGMLDLYSDLTMVHAQTGAHVEVLEMCDLKSCLDRVTPEDIAREREEIDRFFVISGDSPSDPLAKKPTEEQLAWSATVAAAQKKLVNERRLDALTYYYHGADGNEYEQLQSGFYRGAFAPDGAGRSVCRRRGFEDRYRHESMRRAGRGRKLLRDCDHRLR